MYGIVICVSLPTAAFFLKKFSIDYYLNGTSTEFWLKILLENEQRRKSIFETKLKFYLKHGTAAKKS